MRFRRIGAAIAALIVVTALSMATAIPVSLLYNDGVITHKLMIVGTLILIAAPAFLILRDEKAEYSLKDGFIIVGLSWVIVSALGALPYWITGSLPTFVDAMFESMSGFTTTGASVCKDVEILPHSILFWRSLTHWLGGMGIIVLSVAILPLLGVGGMAMFKAEVPSPVMDKLKPTVTETAKTLWKVYIILTGAEILLLCIAGMNGFDSICHTFGSLATGGFSTKNLSLAYYNNDAINIIITVFMLLAGLNFTLHYHALCLKPSAYTKSLEFFVYIGIFTGATLFIACNVYGINHDSVSESLIQSAFQTASIMTTTGFASTDWEKWPWACQWLLFSLMFMGGCAGSTGGGIKCMRLIIVAKHILRELRLLIHPRAVIAIKMDGKVVGTPIVNSVMAFVALFVGVWTVSTMLLVTMEVDVITAIGASAATLSNIGPGLNLVGPLDNYWWMSTGCKILLIFDMLVGRLELYTVFILFVGDFWRR
jgi:trk system potassium uptake protein